MVKSCTKFLLSVLLLPFFMVEVASAQATGDAFSGFRSDNNRQGETTMKTARLDVFYDGSVTPGGVGGNQGISRIEAKGKVIVTSGDNTATGGQAVFNMKTQIVVMSGGRVVLTQCNNVINKASLSGGRVSAVLDRKDANAANKKCS